MGSRIPVGSWMLALIVMVGVESGPAAAAASGQEPSLVEAVKRGDRAAIDAALQQGADVNAAQPDGATALHWAAHVGDVVTLNRLLDAGSDHSVANRFGITPIWLAAQDGHAAVVERLLQAGANPQTTRAESGETVLMIAARGGHTGVLELLLATGEDVNRTEHVRGQTALMWAAAERHRAAVGVLANAGADLEARSSTGLTPLMFAIRAGSINVTEELLDQGADLRETAPDGTTMVVFAIINARYELAAFLLDRGADPNGDDPHGRPLHALAWMRRAENRGLSKWLPRMPSGNLDSIGLAEALLAHGADINDRIDWEDPDKDMPGLTQRMPILTTPQHMAIQTFTTVSFVGATPFYLAAKHCDVPFMKFLVANGANPLIPTHQQVTPLLAAAGVGYVVGESAGTPAEALAAVKLAHELGNDPTAIVDLGESPGMLAWDDATALHGAVLRDAEDLVTWLIDQGVPLDQKSKSDETALDVADGSNMTIVRHVYPNLVALLRRAMIEQGLLPAPVPADNVATALAGAR